MGIGKFGNHGFHWCHGTRGILGLVLGSFLLPGQIAFTRMESPHFELFTDGAKGRASDILEHFERVRSFFLQTINPRETGAKPRVVVLNSAKAFATFVERKSTVAYYLGLPHRDLIVIGPGGKGPDTQTITHEYIHLLVHQAEMRIPLWMNEGIAEVYSTLQPVGPKMRVGTPIPAHMLRLRRDWLDIRQVLKAESYGSEEHVGPFYSMSWAIAHMLLLEDDLRPKWPRFTAAVERGIPIEQALRQSYGLTPQQLEQHVQGYIRGKTVNVVDFNFKWEEWKGTPETRPATALENGLTMVDLFLSGKDVAAAVRHAERLAGDFPREVAPWEALLTARTMERNKEAAAVAAREAFARGSRNADLLAMGATMAGAEGRAMLDRALEVDPEHFEALLALAALQLGAGEDGAAFATLKRVKRLGAAEAARYVRLFVYAAQRSGNGAAAETAVKEFQAYSVNDRDKAEGEKLAGMVGRSVTGVLVEVGCSAEGQVLHVDSGGVREIPVDSRQVLRVSGAEFNLRCGPIKKKPRVRVGVSAEGKARELEILR